MDTVKLTYGTEYTVDGKQVILRDMPPADAIVSIFRETTTERLVSWSDASVLKANDMTLFEVQLLHVAEETKDRVQDSGLALDELDGKWDARLKIMKNLADPQDQLDVMNKRYFESTQAGYIQASQVKVDEATRQAGIATQQATNSAKSAQAAANSNTAAKLSEDKARVSETNAKASELKAKEYADKAKVSETNAKTSETNAGISKETVLATESRVIDHEERVEVLVKEAERYVGLANSFNFLTRLTTYKAGDIANSKLLPSWAHLECIKEGISGANEPDFSKKITAIGMSITDGTCEFIIRHISDNHNIGDIWMFDGEFQGKNPIHKLTGLPMVDAQICDGTNGTPDLRDRFIVGSGSAYTVGAKGGAATVSLTAAQNGAHAHGANAWTDTQGFHTHLVPNVMLGDLGANASGSHHSLGNRETTGNGNHTHNVGVTVAASGTGAAHENRPPYYALAYIMKI